MINCSSTKNGLPGCALLGDVEGKSTKHSKNWHTKPLGDLCDVLDSMRKPITKSDRIAGEFPYYGATGVLDYVEDYIFDEKLVLIGEDGAKWGPGANTAFIVDGKCWVNNHAHVIRPHRNVIVDKWLVYLLNSSDLSCYITGVTVPKLNQEKLRNIPIPTPSLPEQRRIVTILDKAFSAIEKAKVNAEKNVRNAEELFESHLQAAFGKRGEGWTETTLEQVLALQPKNGWSPPSANHSNSGTPVLTLSSVTGFHFKKDKIKFTSSDTDPRRNYWVKNGDLLITRSNTPELVGHVAIVSGLNEPTIYPDLIMRINPMPDRLTTEFLYYQLRSPSLRKAITNKAQGANPTMKKINNRAVRTLLIAVPPIVEQRKITKLINRLSVETQRLQSLYTQKLAALDELRQSLLQKAFRGEL